jgi:catechol 2,3-dioxygenase-like lactoylglutathione lyase family enzyme
MESLSLVALVVPDYDLAVAFYVDAVGFTLVEDTDRGAGRRWVVVSPGAGSAGLLLAVAANDRQRAAIGNQTGGRVGFFLRTDDFGVTLARMQAAGVEFLEEPRHEDYGSVAVWQDPWGNRWDLLGPAPAG